MRTCLFVTGLLPLCCAAWALAAAMSVYAAEEQAADAGDGDAGVNVAFAESPGRLQIEISGRPFATYVYQDPEIPRPYFCSVCAPDGTQVTRNHPPREGLDATDHASLHPGIWLAFGDLNGADFWRHKARVEHVEFAQPPRAVRGGLELTVRNRYQLDGQHLCDETCRFRVLVRPAGYLLLYDSQFSGEKELVFGDQEEMGLGVRLASPLRVAGGSGQILNSEGRLNEKEVWGQQADWCDYSGTVGARRVGAALMADPANFRRSWFHARDYGFFAANPFGRNAFTRGETSRVAVAPGEVLRLRFGVLLHASPPESPVDLAAAYRDFTDLLAEPGPDE